jgi:ribonuclease HII
VAFAPAWLAAHADEVREITDSKKYRSHAARAAWARKLRAWAGAEAKTETDTKTRKAKTPALFFSLQSCTAAEIAARTTPTRDGVAPSVYALMLATARAVVDAVRAADPSAVFDVIVDGAYLPPAFAEAKLPARSMVRADGQVKSVSAASILAKVAHDEYMMAAAAAHPQYAWDKNMGYGTNSHDAALLLHGLCAEHRPAARTRLRRLLAFAKSASEAKSDGAEAGAEEAAKKERGEEVKPNSDAKWTLCEALAIVEQARVHPGRRRTKRADERE